MVVLSHDWNAVGDGQAHEPHPRHSSAADTAESRSTGDASTEIHSPDDVTDTTLIAADAVVITTPDGLERVRGATPSTPIVALTDHPSASVAVDPIVDAWASDLDGVDDRIRWLLARREAGAHRDVAERPSLMERLHAGTTHLAGVRSTEEVYSATVGIIEEVFDVDHGVVGVVDGKWVEPVAGSSTPVTGEYTRVRRGSGVAGTVVETGESRIDARLDHDAYGSALTVPIDSERVLQAVSTEPAAFDEIDRTLGELLASHVEETINRLRIDEALRSERDRMLALFENIPDAAVEYDYVDGEPYVQRVNSAFEETFGYDADRIIGESVDEYIVPPDDEISAEAEELNELLRKGENVRREVTRRTTRGDRHFIVHVIPIHLDAENASGFAVYTDITERREREATLRRQNERLDEFSAIVSHDLRNPLSIADGYLELARETGETAHLERVGDALDRMDELVSDLLSLAREGRMVGETRPESLESTAREAWQSVTTDDAELVIESDRTCEIDPNRVRELFENLFRNSVEHGSTGSRTASGDSVEHGSTGSRTASGDSVEHGSTGSRTASGDNLTIRVGAMDLRSAGGWGFYVEDDGTGFDDEALDALFESGYTTAPNGTGLGLAIVRHIAEAHGWDVRAMTGESGGARFEFRIEP
ncbi:hypothetical protein JCM18237_01820 [Halorubrum luteum]